MKTLLTGLMLWPLAGMGQFYAHFNEEGFANNPGWVGDTSLWQISGGQLKSNSLAPNSSFWISTASTLAMSAQWEFYVQLKFKPSSLNYVDIYVVSDSADLKAAGNAGYFIRIGNKENAVSLYRKDPVLTPVKIIGGRDGVTSHSNNTLKIKLLRDAENSWSLFTDSTGKGGRYIQEGNCTDSSYTRSNYFGILVRQSVASFFQKHFFAAIEAAALVTDTTPPALTELKLLDSSSLLLKFSEPVDKASAKDTLNYLLDQGIGHPLSAIMSGTAGDEVILRFPVSFRDAALHLLTVRGVSDLSGNRMEQAGIGFSYYIPKQYDVIITEIFANPSSTPGLPGYGFIELKNRSPFPISLSGWRFGNNVRRANLSGFTLEPDSLVIVCGRTGAESYRALGPTLGVTNFPVMKNDGDTLLLTDEKGSFIHTLAYDKTWYADEIKSKGGWSLEMIDAGQPCSGKDNWSASRDPAGGTPGRINSVNGSYMDESLPDLLRVYAADSLTLLAVFSKPLALRPAPLAESFEVDHDHGLPATITVNPPFFNTVTLGLSSPLQKGKIYTLRINGLSDCSGNQPGLKNTARFGITEACDSFDVVINEVLFNPPPGGKEFVEIVNRSGKILDLKTLRLANRDKNGSVAATRTLSRENRLFFPGEYIAVSADIMSLQRQYFCREPEALLEIPALPSYPNKSGTVVLLREDGRIMDEFSYHESDHHPLISAPKGISLERVDLNAPSANRDNWHSAASEAGYATPGYQNSQSGAGSESKGTVTLFPEVFTPGYGGPDDRTFIEYRFRDQGNMANITIFDERGRPVRYLARNVLLGKAGKFSWDGLDENRGRLGAGIYIVYFEAFNTKGVVQKFRKTVVIGIKRF